MLVTSRALFPETFLDSRSSADLPRTWKTKNIFICLYLDYLPQIPVIHKVGNVNICDITKNEIENDKMNKNAFQ